MDAPAVGRQESPPQLRITAPAQRQVTNTGAERAARLRTAIEASVADLVRAGGDAHNESLVFVGSWNDSIPRMQIHDPILEPVDKIIWQVLRTFVDPRKGTAFPSHRSLATAANVASKATIVRAIAILRLCRWLTLCGRSRDARGRLLRNIYALHDEPLPIELTLELDPRFMEFVYQHAAANTHARVRNVAAGVAASLEHTAAVTADGETTDPVLARLDAQQIIAEADTDSEPALAASQTPTARPHGRTSFRRWFGTHMSLIPSVTESDPGRDDPKSVQDQNLVLDASSQNLTDFHQDQNLVLDNFRTGAKFDPSCSSSSKALTTTTTTAGRQNFSGSESEATQLPAAGIVNALRWPAWLNLNQRYQGAMELLRIPNPSRQWIVDQLDQRKRDGDHGLSEPLRNPVLYLRRLCELNLSGRVKELIPAAAPAPVSADSGAIAASTELLKLRDQLRTARCDHAHWTRLLEKPDLNEAFTSTFRVFRDRAAETIADCERGLQELHRSPEDLRNAT